VPLFVCRLPGGQPVAQLPFARGVTSLAFTGDGSRLAVGTAGGRLTIWHVRTAELEHEVAATTSPYEAVALSADGTTVAASARDGSIWLRRLPPPAHTDAPPAMQVLKLFDWLRRVAL
jgi:WD40 repeat protein